MSPVGLGSIMGCNSRYAYMLRVMSKCDENIFRILYNKINYLPTGKIMRRKVKKCDILSKAKLMFHEGNRSKQPKCEVNDYTVINKHPINNEAITPCLTSTNKPNTKKKTAHPNSYQLPNKGKRHHKTKHIYKNNFNRASKDKEPVTSFQVPVCKFSTRNEVTNAQQQRKHKKEEHLYDIDKTNNDIEREPILTKFKKITEVQKRCSRLSKEVDHLLKIKKRRCKIFTHETIQYSNFVTDNKSVTVRQKVNEIIIHEYVPLKQKSKAANKEDTGMKNIKKSNDLLRPVSNIINHNEFESVVKRAKILQPLPNLNSWDFRETRVPDIPGPTYDSHGYLKDTQINGSQIELGGTLNNNKFISKMSVDSLVSPTTGRKEDKTQKVTKSLHDKNLNHMEHSDMTKPSYCINFNETDSRTCKTEGAVINTEGAVISACEFCSGSTYTISHLNQPGNADLKENSCRTCTIETNRPSNRIQASSSNLCSERSPNIQNIRNNTAAKDEPLNNNIVFISNSQFATTGKNDNEQMEPFSICETVIETCNKQVLYEKHIENTFTLASTNNDIRGSTEPIEPIRICEAVLGSYENQNPDEIVDNSFILLSTNSTNNLTNNDTKTKAESGALYEFVKEARHNVIQKADTNSGCNNNNKIACDVGDIEFEPDTFNLMYRRRYIPKGMSPIFQHCNSEKILNFELDADYYAPIVYNNFAQNVEIHSEIYKPKIKNVKEAATRDLQRVDMKLSKENACLTFNSASLQNVKVLGQVDLKFIATILNGGLNSVHNCLVLFDQHAVHERIRLEQNMSDYLNKDQWKTVSVDGISLKLTRDDILYLHNYRDKFERLGLQWSITSDTRVLVNAIPAAILGKHLRQVDVILKAVNNLIKEEISIIKEQGGCVSLYPKSIMDLVFSEACRHAIMFGTTLNVPECSHLMEALSRCLTPFQCAHGRPALAVLVDVAQETRPYTVNFTKVELFRKTQIKNVLVR